jgi:hypothetical protein
MLSFISGVFCHNLKNIRSSFLIGQEFGYFVTSNEKPPEGPYLQHRCKAQFSLIPLARMPGQQEGCRQPGRGVSRTEGGKWGRGEKWVDSRGLWRRVHHGQIAWIGKRKGTFLGT